MGRGVGWAVQDVAQLRQWPKDGRKPREMRALRPDWSLESMKTKIKQLRRGASDECLPLKRRRTVIIIILHLHFQLSLILSGIFHMFRLTRLEFTIILQFFMHFSCHLNLRWTRKRSKNLRGSSRNDFRVFDILEGFGHQILSLVLVKPRLIVERFGA